MRCNKWSFVGPLGWFFVAMLVFAPGQTWPEAPRTTRQDGGNLAARMLAPTVDRGLAGDGQVAKRLAQPRDKGSKHRGSPMALAVGVIALALALVAVGIGVPPKPRTGLAVLTQKRDRAPPILQPA